MEKNHYHQQEKSIIDGKVEKLPKIIKEEQASSTMSGEIKYSEETIILVNVVRIKKITTYKHIIYMDIRNTKN